MRGKISRFDHKRRFGFIKTGGRRDDIFFHLSDCNSDPHTLQIGSSVTFDLGTSPKGPCAKGVTVVSGPPAKPLPFFLGASVFVLLATVIVLHLTFQLPVLLEILIGLNVAALMLCGYDKGAAGTTSTRVPELVLFAVAIVGGGPGLLLGMKLFRHKTRKGAFLFLVVVIMIIQLIVFKAMVDQGYIETSKPLFPDDLP